jgi:cytochrome c553
MQSKIKLRMAIAVLAMLSASVVYASEWVNYDELGNQENGKKIFTEGKGDVPACNSCHGPDGMGDDAMGTPRLAGQGFAYVVKQLEDFGADKRKDETMYIMNSNAKGLSEQDRRDVASYVSSLPKDASGSDVKAVKELGTVPMGKRYLGKSLAQHGAPSRGIPACHSCHGYNGRGAYPVYPMIGNQKYVYLVNQLKNWRSGARANDPLGQMRKVASKLTDEDIHNVATFLTTAPRTTMGNDIVPVQR